MPNTTLNLKGLAQPSPRSKNTTYTQNKNKKKNQTKVLFKYQQKGEKHQYKPKRLNKAKERITSNHEHKEGEYGKLELKDSFKRDNMMQKSRIKPQQPQIKPIGID